MNCSTIQPSNTIGSNPHGRILVLEFVLEVVLVLALSSAAVYRHPYKLSRLVCCLHAERKVAMAMFPDIVRIQLGPWHAVNDRSDEAKL